MGGRDRQQPRQGSFPAFGVLVKLSLWNAEPEQERAAARMMRAELEHPYRPLHPWSPGAGLERLNREPAEEDGAVLPELLQ